MYKWVCTQRLRALAKCGRQYKVTDMHASTHTCKPVVMQTVNCEIQLAAVEQLAYTAKFKSRYRSGQTTTLVKYPIYLESRH